MEAAATQTTSGAGLVRDLRAHMDKLVEEGRFTGAVLVAKDGETLLKNAYGFANHAFNAKNSVDTKFNLASVGKLITAVAIMQLVEDGTLSVGNPLSKVVPGYPNKADAQKITVRHLLQHASGLTDFDGEPCQPKRGMPCNHLDALAALDGRPLKFEPGQGKFYSNAGFVVLGAVVEQVSGKNFYDYVRERIFEPAGMHASGYYSMYEDVPNLAIGYTRHAVPGYPPLPQDALGRPVPLRARGNAAGGAYATLDDMLRFSEALRTHQILKRESLELMLAGGYGPVSGSAHGVRYLGHGGGTFGGSTYFEIYPDVGYSVVVLANNDEGATLVSERLRQQLSGAELPKMVHLSAETLQQFEGEYEAASSATWGGMMAPGAALEKRPISVVADRDGLWIDLGWGSKRRFVPLSDTVFFDRDTLGPARLIFTKDDQGKITGVDIKGSGPIQTTTAKKLASSQGVKSEQESPSST